MSNEWMSWLLDWVYPPRCMSCDTLLPRGELDIPNDMRVLSGEKWICRECWPLLEWIEEPVCEKCGRPVDGEDLLCRECRGKSLFFEKNYSVFIYDNVIKDMIHKFKYHGHAGYGRGLGAMLARKLEGQPFADADYIVPVPMFHNKERKRGYNQAAVLAGAVSANVGVPTRTDMLIRTKDTKPQSALSAKAREHNIRDAFAVNKKDQISAKKIIVIDDIYTTGSTLSACSAVLLQNGADKVYGVTLSAAVAAFSSSGP